MSKDYALMTVIPYHGTWVLELNKCWDDDDRVKNYYFRLDPSEEQFNPPFKSFKMTKERAQEFCNDLMSLFD